ncbi:hypothetical protein [Macrococcus brunensis]|uniref:hypothetical protein n=1 Tax=Macrococcus brunensis TaxID=198483 RepID=UPI001EF0E0C9|nr:hypothetical protein [Macrococcus brunensis]ULG71909.1 hypothetical protein MGG12_11650 [Macrococcus brunensis]ULG74164.1 hypothetical protein MGG13_11135 [Macrococcus brunensis]
MVKVVIQELVQEPGTGGDGGGEVELESLPKVGDHLDLEGGTKGVVTEVDTEASELFNDKEDIEAVVTVQLDK